MNTNATNADGVTSIEIVDAFFDEIFHTLEGWEPQVRKDLEDGLSNGTLSGGQLALMVEEESLRILEQATLPIYGAGFCASAAVVAQGNPLAWWQGPEHTPLASSTFGVGPGAVDLRRLEWYRVPELTGERNVAGPFVDYLCSNEVTITSSLPIHIDDVFAGVLCLDVLIGSIEEFLLPRLAQAEVSTIINSSGRVVVSTDPFLETGDRCDVEKQIKATSGHIASSEKYPFSLITSEHPFSG